MANIFTQCVRLFDSRPIGRDPYGNRYYQRRRLDAWGRLRRFIIYKGADDASLVPPEYHGWLHYTTDEFPRATSHYRPFYQRPHQANVSGSRFAYQPDRAPATSDYQPWSPTAAKDKKAAGAAATNVVAKK
ncbi:MAG: NADH-ubiquinone oxidoreductase subunit NDUFA12 family protein [Alphaproteobacteria bacterium]|nr:NADH-ubiquinone oxidoreductase subunit NDUFA12 family protein [Alphaproteobacteria bacterium]